MVRLLNQEAADLRAWMEQHLPTHVLAKDEPAASIDRAADKLVVRGYLIDALEMTALLAVSLGNANVALSKLVSALLFQETSKAAVFQSMIGSIEGVRRHYRDWLEDIKRDIEKTKKEG